MWQAVREPTRKEYLLDLVLTDIQNTSIRILPYVADHKGILATLPSTEVLEMSFEREAAAYDRITQVGIDVANAYWQDRGGRFAAKHDYHCGFCGSDNWAKRKACRQCRREQSGWWHRMDCNCGECPAPW